MKMQVVSLLLLISLVSRYLPVRAQETSGSLGEYIFPGERLVTLQPELHYAGQSYNVHYLTTGPFNNRTASFFNLLDSVERTKSNQITGLLVTEDGSVLQDGEKIQEILTVYRSAYYLYEVQPEWPLGNVDDQFVDEMRTLSTITQFITLNFDTPELGAAEALRGILTTQLQTPEDVEEFDEKVKRSVETKTTFIEAVDLELENARFSNDPAVREIGKDLRKIFESWRLIPNSDGKSVSILNKSVHLSNALNLVSLSVQLIWLTGLQKERAEWLDQYISFAQGAAALDASQSFAASTVIDEADSQWRQRWDIVWLFIREKAVDLAVKKTLENLAQLWVKTSWNIYGKRIVGHSVAGIASSVLIGWTLGRLIYGLDDLHENFSVGVQADDLRRRFREGRYQLQRQVANQSHEYYDGELSIQYRAAYMLESLAAARMLRFYADGVDATVRENLTKYLNPIHWFKGKEWQDAAAELRQMGIQVEREAEDTLGHPAFIENALEMINLRIQQAKLTVDDASPGFARSGEADFWKTVDAGFAGRATWTLNEQGKTINTGRWTPPLERPGVYRVEAYIPSFSDRLAQSYSSSVSYTLSHMGLETEIEKNQANFAGKWLDLGVYYFEADGNEYLTLSDQTGEPAGTTAVVFDAVRWTPVVDYDRAIDAAAGSRFTYDLVLPGETAVLEFKVTNAGLTPWEGAIFALYPDADNPDGAREALFLKERVMPGETTSWMVRVPVVNVSGVQTVRYRMQLAGEPFGETITGYIFILPEQLQGIEEELRGKIDGLLAQGEQAAKDLAQQVLAEIQKKLEERARKAIDDLLLQCQMPVALLIMGVLFPVYKRRKRD